MVSRAQQSRAKVSLPPGTRRPHQKGNPRPFWGFRPTAGLEAFVSSYLVKERLEKSGALVYLLEISSEVIEELGPLWYEVERMAKVEGTSPGRVLARFAREALGQESPKRKK